MSGSEAMAVALLCVGMFAAGWWTGRLDLLAEPTIMEHYVHEVDQAARIEAAEAMAEALR